MFINKIFGTKGTNFVGHIIKQGEDIMPENYSSILVQMRLTGMEEAQDFIRKHFDKSCIALNECNKESKDPYTRGYHDAVKALQDIMHTLTSIKYTL